TPINSPNLSSKNKKIKPVNRDSLLTLKKLIKELTTPIFRQILLEKLLLC
ncbi:3837_t:CDS:2, partial [Racocetra fulgida]